jgi:hypothetical protein
MTVESTTRRAQYDTNGTTGPWTVPFYFLANADLEVIYTDAAGVETTLTLTTHYSVTGAGVPSGGAVTTVASYASGGTITVLRSVAILQETDYVETDAFPAAAHETALDRLTMIAQQQGEALDRTLTFPASDEISGALPPAATRANRLLAFDATGAPEESPFTTTQAASAIAAAYTGMGTADAAAFIAAGTGAVTTTVQEVLRRYVDARGYATLADAEARAYALGVALWMSPGNYTVDGAFTCRVPIWGWGATLTQINATKTVTNASTLYMSGLTDAFVVGLTINGGNTWGGFLASACTNLKLIDVAAADSVGHGFYVDLCNGVEYARCRSDGVLYNHAGTSGVPVSGGSADGFYNGGSTDVTYESCVADGFYRIGFVSEGSGATKSARVKFINCLALNGSNCDFSSTEYNTGFWAENTNGADFVDCTVRNIAGNAGQTSGRVRGMTLSATGSNVECLHTATRCRVFGGAGRVPQAFTIGPVAGTIYQSVLMRDCFASFAAIGVNVGGGYNSIDISGVDFDDVNFGALVDAAGATISVLNIDDLSATNTTFAVDTGLVHIYSAIAGCEYTVSRIKGSASHIMRASIPKITARDCALVFGGTLYSTFISPDLKIDTCRLVLDTLATNTKLWNPSAAGSGSVTKIVNSNISAAATTVLVPDGTDASIYVSDSFFDKVSFLSGTVGSFVHSFDNVNWTGLSTTWGAYKKDGAPVAATRHELIVRNCRFVGLAVGNTPLLKGSSGTAGKDNPTYSVLQSNTYNTTAFYDFAAGVTNTANTQTL